MTKKPLTEPQPNVMIATCDCGWMQRFVGTWPDVQPIMTAHTRDWHPRGGGVHEVFARIGGTPPSIGPTPIQKVDDRG